MSREFPTRRLAAGSGGKDRDLHAHIRALERTVDTVKPPEEAFAKIGWRAQLELEGPTRRGPNSECLLEPSLPAWQKVFRAIG